MAKLSMKLKQSRPAKFSTRAYTRCRICGRPHSVLRKYGVCRVCTGRELSRTRLLQLHRQFSHFTNLLP